MISKHSQLQKLKTWIADLYQKQCQPPLKKRMPLYLEGLKIGSVESEVAQILVNNELVLKFNDGLLLNSLYGDHDEALAKIAQCLATHELSGVWRDELLAVTDKQGKTLASVERAVVRPLGITTYAVYLIGVTAAGVFWLQRRAAHKATSPGKLDALVSGLVIADESLMQALIRESTEEAGLVLSANTLFKQSGHFITQCPIDDAIGGYMMEHGSWYLLELPENVLLHNEDGEVSDFVCLSPVELIDAMLIGDLTQESSYIFTELLKEHFDDEAV